MYNKRHNARLLEIVFLYLANQQKQLKEQLKEIEQQHI